MLSTSHSLKNIRDDNPDELWERDDSAQKGVIKNSFNKLCGEDKE